MGNTQRPSTKPSREGPTNKRNLRSKKEDAKQNRFVKEVWRKVFYWEKNRSADTTSLKLRGLAFSILRILSDLEPVIEGEERIAFFDVDKRFCLHEPETKQLARERNRKKGRARHP